MRTPFELVVYKGRGACCTTPTTPRRQRVSPGQPALSSAPLLSFMLACLQVSAQPGTGYSTYSSPRGRLRTSCPPRSPARHTLVCLKEGKTGKPAKTLT